MITTGGTVGMMMVVIGVGTGCPGVSRYVGFALCLQSAPRSLNFLLCWQGLGKGEVLVYDSPHMLCMRHQVMWSNRTKVCVANDSHDDIGLCAQVKLARRLHILCQAIFRPEQVGASGAAGILRGDAKGRGVPLEARSLLTVQMTIGTMMTMMMTS
jgi:hypothetical protein